MGSTDPIGRRVPVRQVGVDFMTSGLQGLSQRIKRYMPYSRNFPSAPWRPALGTIKKRRSEAPCCKGPSSRVSSPLRVGNAGPIEVGLPPCKLQGNPVCTCHQLADRAAGARKIVGLRQQWKRRLAGQVRPHPIAVMGLCAPVLGSQSER